jgi:hypothetical protein
MRRDSFGWPRSTADTKRLLARSCRGFFGSGDTDPTKPDGGVGAGEISIQCQRMFTFSDAKRGASREYVDKSQPHMATHAE